MSPKFCTHTASKSGSRHGDGPVPLQIPRSRFARPAALESVARRNRRTTSASTGCMGFERARRLFCFLLCELRLPSANSHPGSTLETRASSNWLTQQVARVVRVCFPVMDFFPERGSSINRMLGGNPILIRSASRCRTVMYTSSGSRSLSSSLRCWL
jgi:hypothetical protein